MTHAYDALMTIVRSRRSIRRFRSEPVAQDLIEKLIEAARWAPSASNRQAYRFLAIEDRATLEAMATAVREASRAVVDSVRSDAAQDVESYLANFVHFRSAPLVLAPIRRSGVDLLAASSLRASSLRTEAGLLDAHASVAAATMNLLLAVEALGLGACWMTGPLLAAPALSQVLCVPQGWDLTALIPIGHPDESPTPPRRRPVERLCKRVGPKHIGEVKSS